MRQVGLTPSVRNLKAWDVATTHDWVAGVHLVEVAAVTLNLPHPDPFGVGPFCRLRVQTTAPQEPGGLRHGRVRYVGKAVEGVGLIEKVKGQPLGRARSPLVLQLPLDCTYCRTWTGGDMQQVCDTCQPRLMADH